MVRSKGEGRSFHVSAWHIMSAQHAYIVIDIMDHSGTRFPELEAPDYAVYELCDFK